MLLFYPYLDFLWDSINNNHDQPMGEQGKMIFPRLSPLRSVKTASEALNSLGMLRKS